MAITHMAEKAMHKKISYLCSHSKRGLLISVIAFVFFGFSSFVYAVDYGSGLYNFDPYSSTIPSTTASPVAGIYNASQNISLEAEESDSIRYSIITTPADCSSGTLYVSPIQVISSQTIYVRACDSFGNSSITSFTYIISKGSSLPLTAYNPPALPTGGFKLTVNQGTSATSSRIVNLNLNANSDVKKMAISLTEDFNDAIQEDYQPNKQLDLCSKFGGLIKNSTCSNGTYTVYVKYYTEYGITSDVISQKINLTGSSTNSGQTSYNFGTKTLRNGSKGEPVKELQRFLNDVLNLGLKVDGILGPKTIAVIKKYQKDNDLVVDGLVGVKTKAKMNTLIQ